MDDVLKMFAVTVTVMRSVLPIFVLVEDIMVVRMLGTTDVIYPITYIDIKYMYYFKSK